jgi:DNA (cytosine-5)-methyltransferase 1
MRYGSVCSGIEAASAAWHPLGWQAAWLSEIEPFPCSVLKHHYPDVPNLGDMTKWETWPDEPIDVLVGGTPCQSFSVAGKRGGMDDHRGQLALSFSAIAKRYKPRWIVWENVPGVLSSGGGRDFGAFLGSLAELGYGCAYRVLDAQHFGVAQRRRRVFVVGHLGDWRRAAAVLFERESLQRDSAKGGKARKGIAGTLSSRTTAGGGLGTDFDLAGGLQVVPPLTARMAKGRCTDGQDEQASYPHLICMAHGQGGAEIRENSSPTLTCNHEAPIIAGVQRSTPAWVECPEECGDYWCNIHQQHTGDCECPPIDEWETDPYGMQLEGPAAKQPIVSSNGSGPTVMQSMQVRRLTPTECERLQGFSDNYTNVPHRGKPAADGPRYKALGNSMAVPVMAWIGRRIQMVEDLIHD